MAAVLSRFKRSATTLSADIGMHLADRRWVCGRGKQDAADGRVHSSCRCTLLMAGSTAFGEGVLESSWLRAAKIK